MTLLNTYINFKSDAREAMQFYQSVLGGQLDVSTFGEFPGMTQDPAEAHLVMHSQLTTDDGLVLMGSDTPASMGHRGNSGYAVSISGDDRAALQGYWDGLTEGAEITMPLGEAPWGGLFGMFTDRFGIDWMVSIDTGETPS